MNDSNDFAALLAEFDQSHQGTADQAAKPAGGRQKESADPVPASP